MAHKIPSQSTDVVYPEQRATERVVCGSGWRRGGRNGVRRGAGEGFGRGGSHGECDLGLEGYILIIVFRLVASLVMISHRHKLLSFALLNAKWLISSSWTKARGIPGWIIALSNVKLNHLDTNRPDPYQTHSMPMISFCSLHSTCGSRRYLRSVVVLLL